MCCSYYVCLYGRIHSGRGSKPHLIIGPNLELITSDGQRFIWLQFNEHLDHACSLETFCHSWR